MSTFKYLIVDDDALNNLICRKVIKKAVPDAEIVTFLEPEHGLDYLLNLAPHAKPVLLFLDINMPTMTGWEFLSQFERYDEGIRNRVVVYILSSSVDERDIEKAHSNILVKGFYSKPLTEDMVRKAA